MLLFQVKDNVREKQIWIERGMEKEMKERESEREGERERERNERERK